jgi:hypothetical protein
MIDISGDLTSFNDPEKKMKNTMRKNPRLLLLCGHIYDTSVQGNGMP